jgi:hypothetical protein
VDGGPKQRADPKGHGGSEEAQGGLPERRTWRSDAALRADARLAAGLLGRLARKPPVWLSAGVLLVGTLLGIAAVVDGITG